MTAIEITDPLLAAEQLRLTGVALSGAEIAAIDWHPYLCKWDSFVPEGWAILTGPDRVTAAYLGVEVPIAFIRSDVDPEIISVASRTFSIVLVDSFEDQALAVDRERFSAWLTAWWAPVSVDDTPGPLTVADLWWLTVTS